MSRLLADLKLGANGEVLCSHPMMRRPGINACGRPATHVAVIHDTRLAPSRDIPLCPPHASGWRRTDLLGDTAVVGRIESRLASYAGQIKRARGDD